MIICYCRHSPTKTDSPFFRNLWRWIYTFQLAWFVHSMDLISCMYAWVMWDVLLDTWVIWWHVLALLADTSNSKERGELATETAVWSWIAELSSSSQQVAVMQAELTELMPKLMITVSICTIVGFVSVRWVSQEKNSASALCQITPSEQGIPKLSAPSTLGRCLFWECPAPCVTLLTNMIGNQEANDAIPLKISSALVHHPAFWSIIFVFCVQILILKP